MDVGFLVRAQFFYGGLPCEVWQLSYADFLQQEFLHVDTGFIALVLTSSGPRVIMSVWCWFVASGDKFGKAWFSVYSMRLWGAVCQRARQPIPSIYADIVEAYPRNERVGTHTHRAWGISRCQPCVGPCSRVPLAQWLEQWSYEP